MPVRSDAAFAAGSKRSTKALCAAGATPGDKVGAGDTALAGAGDGLRADSGFFAASSGKGVTEFGLSG